MAVPNVSQPTYALSVVTTLYRSEPYLDEFYERVTTTIKELGIESYELIFVNDGSPDGSADKVKSLMGEDERVVLVDLSRNFGHHKAIMTGLEYAGGDRIFLVDCDLEEDPELLGLLVETMQERGCDVVYGEMPKRRGGWFNRVTGNVYYRLMNFWSGIDFPRNLLTLRLMSRRYVKSLLLHRERELLISGIWYLTGYEQVAVSVIKHSTSPTTYSFSKRLELVLSSIISFSDKPIRWIFYIGLTLSLLCLFAIIIICLRWAFVGVGIKGWTSLVLSVLFMGGMNMLFLGVIGLYVGTIFIETKGRPNTIVREVLRKDNL